MDQVDPKDNVEMFEAWSSFDPRFEELNKKYFTDIPVDFLKFSHMCEKSIGLDKSKSIWNRLFNNNDLVAEVSPKKHMNSPMFFNPEDLGIHNKYNLKIA